MYYLFPNIIFITVQNKLYFVHFVWIVLFWISSCCQKHITLIKFKKYIWFLGWSLKYIITKYFGEEKIVITACVQILVSRSKSVCAAV